MQSLPLLKKIFFNKKPKKTKIAVIKPTKVQLFRSNFKLIQKIKKNKNLQLFPCFVFSARKKTSKQT